MSCDLDPINMCCWTHGTDIDMSEYMEGYCSMGDEDEDLEGDETDFYSDESDYDINPDIGDQ